MNRRASERSRHGCRNPGRRERGSTAIDALIAIDIGCTRPCWQSVLGEVREAAAERRARRAGLEPRPSIQSRARVEAIDPEDASSDLRPARADEPGEADDLASAQLERDVREARLLVRAPRPAGRRRRSPPPPSGRVVQRPTDHQPDDLALRQLGCRSRRDVAPVAEHGDGVRDRHDLLEPVADEDDRDAAVAQPRTVAKRLSTSCGESAAVGSSMIRRRALDESAFAISRS